MNIEQDREGFILRATRKELSMINNALNEICHGIHVSDFETRVGATLAEAEALLERVHAALARSR